MLGKFTTHVWTETVCSGTAVKSLTKRVYFRPSWVITVWKHLQPRCGAFGAEGLHNKGFDSWGGGRHLAAAGVDLIQIVCPLAGFTTAVVYRSSLILHRPQMTPRRVFISRRDDSFTGKHLGCCNHNFISLFLVKSSRDERDAVAGMHLEGGGTPTHLLPSLGGAGYCFIPPPADLVRPTDLVATTLCQSQLQPVSTI